MKQILLFLTLLLTSISAFSQDTIIVTPKNVQVVFYTDTSSIEYKKEVDSSFLIKISDENVVITTKFQDGASMEYKVKETIFSDKDNRILRCETSSGTELLVTYCDVREEFGCVWVVIDFKNTEYRYQSIKN